MVYVLGEGWKELKVGSVFRVEQERVLAKDTLEEEGIGQAREVSYVAHLGGAEAFGKLLWAEAQRRGWNEQKQSLFLVQAAEIALRLRQKAETSQGQIREGLLQEATYPPS